MLDMKPTTHVENENINMNMCVWEFLQMLLVIYHP